MHRVKWKIYGAVYFSFSVSNNHILQKVICHSIGKHTKRHGVFCGYPLNQQQPRANFKTGNEELESLLKIYLYRFHYIYRLQRNKTRMV